MSIIPDEMLQYQYRAEQELRIQRALAIYRLSIGVPGYEGDGPQSADCFPASALADAIKIIADKTAAAQRRGAVMADALAALATQWRSDGRPHRFEID